MDAYLIVVEGAKPAKVRLKLPTIIGRSAEADVKVRNAQTSRQHCEVYEFEGELAVRDLDSSNGTFVNGDRISEPTFLGPGDELQVGPIVMRAAYQPQVPTPESTGESTGAVDDVSDSETAADANIQAPLSAEPVDIGTENVMDEQPVAAETPDSAASISSIVRYSETDGGSFIGIEELGDAPQYDDPSPSQISALTGDDASERDNPSHSQIAGLAGESPVSLEDQADVFDFHDEKKSKIGSGDSALNDFLKDFDN